MAAAAQAGRQRRITHVEVFASPPARVAVGKGTAARIRLADTGKTLDARPGESLLETLERYGYKPEFSCRAGACGTCALRKLSGKTRGDEGGPLTGRERSSGYVLGCVAQPVGDVTLASAGGKGARAPIAARARNSSAKTALRVALVAATATVFFNVWGMTNHAVSASGSTNSSSSSSSSSAGSSNSSNSIELVQLVGQQWIVRTPRLRTIRPAAAQGCPEMATDGDISANTEERRVSVTRSGRPMATDVSVLIAAYPDQIEQSERGR